MATTRAADGACTARPPTRPTDTPATSAAGSTSGLLLAGGLADRAGAQPAIPWWSVDGGGAMFSTGGSISLGATIGQHDAGVMTGGAITLRGGFWMVAAATPPCPGDADGDGDDDQDDIVLFNFLNSVPPGTNGDLDGNGIVNQDDIDLVVFYYGTSCP